MKMSIDNLKNMLVSLEKLKKEYDDDQWDKEDLREVLNFYKRALILSKNKFYQPNLRVIDIALSKIQNMFRENLD